MSPTMAGWTRCSRKTCSSDTTRVYLTDCKFLEHKEDLTSDVRSA
jgi:hypothetical protein